MVGYLLTVETDGHGVKREGAEEVAAHALFYLAQGAGGRVNPVDGSFLDSGLDGGSLLRGDVLGEGGQLRGQVKVTDELRGAGDDEEQVFKQTAQGAKQADGFFLAVGAEAVALGGVEKLRVVWLAECRAEQDEGVLSAGEVSGEIDGEGVPDGSFGEACGEGAIGRLEFRTALGEQRFDFSAGERAEAMNDGAGADGGEHFLRVFSEQDEGSVLRGLFEDFEQAVGRFLHERRGSENGKSAFGLDGRTVIGDVDDLTDLAELDEQLRRVGRNDEHVGVGLDEDAGFALIGFAQGVAGFNSFGDTGFKIGGVGDPEAVGALPAEIGQAIGFRGLEAVDGFGEHQGQGVFAGAAGAGEDERVGKTPGADTFAQMGDGLRVAEKILEAHGLSVMHFRPGRVFQPDLEK